MDDYYTEVHHYYDNVLNLCGCGMDTECKVLIRDVLKMQDLFSKDKSISHEEKNKLRKTFHGDTVNSEIMFEVILKVLDSCGFLTHGGSIYNAFLTEDGERFLHGLDLYLEEEN